VLIVDDNDDVREVLAFMVSTAGYNVETAADGREALEKLRSKLPCVVVLDLMMPEMDGQTFRRAQLADENEAVREIPVVCYSAAPDLRKTAEEMGVDYVEKTGEIGELLQEIRRRCPN
jgi:CheY-like chemotaxis protein